MVQPLANFPFPLVPLTYLESLLLCGAIPSTLIPGCSWTDLPLPIPTPFPPHSNFPTPGFFGSIVRPTKTTSRSGLHTVRNRYIAHNGQSCNLGWCALCIHSQRVYLLQANCTNIYKKLVLNTLLCNGKDVLAESTELRVLKGGGEHSWESKISSILIFKYVNMAAFVYK
jgi:hypothetical protein